MNNLILVEDFIDDNCQEEILNAVESVNFPYFFQLTTSENFMQFAHTLMNRNKFDESSGGEINSDFFDFFAKIFLNICKKHDINVNNILRGAINCTFNHHKHMCDIHVDHQFQHKVFILYLNEFSCGSTLIFDTNLQLLFTSKPEKGKYIIFNGLPHSHGFCGPGENRKVLVFTFT